LLETGLQTEATPFAPQQNIRAGRSNYTPLLVWGLVALLLTISLIALPNRESPGRDAGVFLYGGQLLLDGKLPYRDLFDHKPPGIFIVNALGLLLSGGRGWGIWLLEAVSLWVGLCLSYATLRRFAGGLNATVATGIGAAGFALTVERGNFTEEFAFPLQWVALYLASDERWGWRAYVIGLIGGGLFLLKPNLIGVILAIGLYLLFSYGWRRKFVELLRAGGLLVAGSATILLITFGTALVTGTLNDMNEAVFRYNFAYVSISNRSRLELFLKSFEPLIYTGLPLLGVAGWFLAAGQQFIGKIQLPFSVAGGLIWLPLEIILLNLSGRLYLHYWLALLPVLVLFTSYQLSAISRALRATSYELPAKPFYSSIINPQSSILVTIGVLTLFVLAGREIAPVDRITADYRANLTAARSYIEQNTTRGEPVLLWGGETALNWATGRPSPTRYTYQYPLFTASYAATPLLNDFLAAIRRNPPRFIIDTRDAPGSENVIPLDETVRNVWLSDRPKFVVTPEITALLDFFKANYTEIGAVRADGWKVYRLKGR
jgi:hypothetical protein